MVEIQTVFDQRRGCGDRSEGGLYMMGGALGEPCMRMPFALTVCGCCGQGVKPTRGFTWINTALLMQSCQINCFAKHCSQCPLGGAKGRMGLIWVGGQFYERPIDFTRETMQHKLNGELMGISRRIPALPNGFEIGKTWVLLAHRDCIPPELQMDGAALGGDFIDDENFTPPVEVDGEPHKFLPGIFAAFKPSRIEYVVRGDETEDELERMVRRGITPVKVVRLGEKLELKKDDGDEE